MEKLTALSRANLAVLVLLLAVLPLPVDAQVNRDAYQPSNLDDVMAIYRLQVTPEDLVGAEANLIKPESKYRLRLRATGRMRDISPDADSVLGALSFRHPNLSAFLKEYTHEVEVVYSGKSIWLFWQRQLVVPFLAERRGGGLIDVYAVLAGNRGSELQMLVTAYEAVPDGATEPFRR